MNLYTEQAGNLTRHRADDLRRLRAFRLLADRVHFFKEESKGVTAMCKAMEDMRNEAVHEHAIESAKAMIASGKLTQEEIAIFSGLTLEEIKSLIPKCPAQKHNNVSLAKAGGIPSRIPPAQFLFYSVF